MKVYGAASLFFLFFKNDVMYHRCVFGLCRYSVGNYRTNPLAYCPPGRYLCIWVYPGTSPLRSDVHRLLMVVPSRHQLRKYVRLRLFWTQCTASADAVH